jgi:large subunit ribosomal protein L5e
MGFVKVVKNRAYFMRFQVKFRRRRECKTDYYARRRLILNDKNKYKTPKYRMVVRFTNRDIVAQIVSADLDHDNVLASAYSHELQNYGVTCGLRNYAAAYATGLLLARRVNLKYNLAEVYEGNTEEDIGEEYHVEAEGDRAPFKALLDVGLARTTTGARLFGALKGACDGGLNVPHNSRRFPGTVKEDGEYVPNPERHREYITGGHVGDYMRTLAEEGSESSMFSQYKEAGIDADGLEDMYINLHAAIREDPHKARDPLQKGYFAKRSKAVKAGTEYEKKYFRPQRISKQQRMARVKAKLLHQGCETLASHQ